jgi:NAD(P)-dependent dehydrogenase (short-subunit alcohol dehydrogenase family)
MFLSHQVFTINAIAPAIINARLKKLMERNIADMKFIVNVSAMEGKFYRFKNETHPHTNMAKASLNMMTRTSAQDYVKSRIYMTAVDTGWINDEKPLPQAQQHFQV